MFPNRGVYVLFLNENDFSALYLTCSYNIYLRFHEMIEILVENDTDVDAEYRSEISLDQIVKTGKILKEKRRALKVKKRECLL